MGSFSCDDKAAQLLTGRPHFVAELEIKLRRRGYDEDEIKATVARLTSQGLLDDERLAHDFVAQRLRRSPEGRRKLYAELGRRGVPSAIAGAAIEANVPDDDVELARSAAQRWSGYGRKSPAALARHLERKGFSSRAIVTVLRDLPDADEVVEALD